MTREGILFPILNESIPDWLGEFAQTPSMQRLKGIGMNCGLEYTQFPIYRYLTKPYSRYEHSIGVALIIWHFTHDLAQSAAGLFHDISTPVFAHVIDFLNHDHLRQESTEGATRQILENDSQLQSLLKKWNLRTDQVADYHQYPIADNDSPQLSADRLEYTLGNAIAFQAYPLSRLQALFEDLVVSADEYGQPELVFQSFERAREFARLALINSWIYVADEDRYAMQRLANLVGQALALKVLVPQDLMSSEAQVIAKLKKDPLTVKAWEAYCQCAHVRRHANPDNPSEWLQIPAKLRWIDPLVKGQGRLSQMDSFYHAEIEQFLRQDQTLWLRAD